MNYNELKFMIEAETGGKNTVILDDVGKPSIMVKIPKLTYADVGIGSGNAVLPAFIVDGRERDYIYVSKYQNVVEGGRAYSWPMRDPANCINFDDARRVCEAKGAGWHLMTNAEWAAIALWCLANGYMPRGNNNFGSDFSRPYEKGVPTYKDNEGRTCRVATGSGPVSWAHDGTNAGIFDLNGNVWEWITGMRIVNGEIQIIQDNNAAVRGTDVSASSPLWRAINQSGSLVSPGSTGTLKYSGDKIVTGVSSADSSQLFETLVPDTGVTIPNLLKALALFPLRTGLDGDWFWMTHEGERIPIRGADWWDGAGAGVWSLNLGNPRSNSDLNLGFRSSYYEV